MHILDTALDEIEREVAAHPAERGGALLGPAGRSLVTRFLADPQGRTSDVSYNSSDQLEQHVRRVEREENLEFKGILHSHPAGMDHPSGQDHRAYADSLRLNPARGTFLAPIVTHRRADPQKPHEIPLAGAKMSVYRAVPSVDGGVQVFLTPTTVVPLGRHVRAAADALGGRVTTEPVPGTFAGALVLTATITRPDGEELTVLAHESYPLLPPTVLRTPPDGRTEAVALDWRPGQELAPALTRALGGSPAPGTVRAGLAARTRGMVSEKLAGRRVLIAGAGSVGSVLADLLVRSGVERLTLIDPDEVSPENLSRSVYRVADLGRPKTEALADHLRSIQPAADVTTVSSTIAGLGDGLGDLVRSHHLVIGCTDDPAAQAALNYFAGATARPSLYVGLYAGAKAGELVYSVPGITTCYRCATGIRHSSDAVRPAVDYGTGRLAGEVALGPDIAHVTTAAAKMALALLHLDEDTPARDFLWPALIARHNVVLLSNVREFDFFPRVFDGIPNQDAYQSVWMEAEGDPECEVCGEHRAEPVFTPAPAADDLKSALATN
ncbi:ThiF family adenylyltransferase [Actinoplanes bogorensis]|uniref:ThiF family adenylyltransferase n=1 Tax=Paractinoplanes bogorensis TaxID=1610840 RepID=A0ABS5YSK0_9ACTN|nr:ThiF family adenylyltransferase [Actinoplanes bogorensis]MBU2666410.1 ThiF family adenylyltransferase [Actinoplanes bogorensis]